VGLANYWGYALEKEVIDNK